MGKRDYYAKGAWNARCDVCGFKRKSFEMQPRWDGAMVCMPSVHEGCWEPRHPQDFVRARPDGQPPPWLRPDPSDTEIDVRDTTVEDLG